MLKSLSFIIHSGRKDQFGRFFPQLIELVVDALKTPNANSLHAQVIFLIRILLARSSSENLTPLWPVVLTEIIRACEDSDDLEVLYQACKFIDLALIIAPRQFQLYQWMFFVDKSASLETNDRRFDASEINEFKNFIPHLLFLSRRIQKDNTDFKEPKSSFNVFPKQETITASGTLRRPLLTNRRISNLAQLIGFHDTLCEWISLNSFNANPPDYDFIDNLLLCDFIEYGDEYEDPMTQASIQNEIASSQVEEEEKEVQVLDQAQEEEINKEIARYKEEGLL